MVVPTPWWIAISRIAAASRSGYSLGHCCIKRFRPGRAMQRRPKPVSKAHQNATSFVASPACVALHPALDRLTQQSREEHAEIKRLKREVAELRRANEILKAGGCRTNEPVAWPARGVWHRDARVFGGQASR